MTCELFCFHEEQPAPQGLSNITPYSYIKNALLLLHQTIIYMHKHCTYILCYVCVLCSGYSIYSSSYHYAIPHVNILHIVTPHNVHFRMHLAECTTSVSPYYRMCAHTVFPPGREIGEASNAQTYVLYVKILVMWKKRSGKELASLSSRNTHCMYIHHT